MITTFTYTITPWRRKISTLFSRFSLKITTFASLHSPDCSTTIPVWLMASSVALYGSHILVYLHHNAWCADIMQTRPFNDGDGLCASSRHETMTCCRCTLRLSQLQAARRALSMTELRHIDTVTISSTRTSTSRSRLAHK